MDNETPETRSPGIGSDDHGKAKGALFTEPASGAAAGEGRQEARSKSGLPVAEPFQALSSVAPGERTGVFNQLVTGDADIAGLVAYSIYKQNKLDWLTAFEAAKGRAPNADELASYIIGEGTPRRIATYRHLAEATLAGNGPAVGGPIVRKGPRPGIRTVGGFGDKATVSPAALVTYGLVAVLFLVGFLLAAHYTMSSR